MELYVPRGVRVPPMSRKELADISRTAREALGIGDETKPDLVRIIEHNLGRLGLVYDYRDPDDPKMQGVEALSWPDAGELWITEDLLDSLERGEGRPRFTLAHEIAHLLLHHDMPVHNGLARGNASRTHKAYEDSEWQADTFAAELLMPVALVRQYCTDEADIQRVFAVSMSAAIARANNMSRHNLW